MIRSDQILLSNDKSFLKAARIFYFLNNSIFWVILKSLIMLGGLSFFLLVLWRVIDVEIGIINFCLRGFLALGVLSLVVFIFNARFFRDLEDSNALVLGESYDYLKTIDYSVAKIISQLNISQLSATDLLAVTAKSRRARFILEELGVTAPMLEKIGQDLSAGDQIEKVRSVFSLSVENALSEKSVRVTSGDVLFGILKTSTIFDDLLRDLELTEEDFKSIVFWENRVFEHIYRPKTLTEKMMSRGSGVAQDWSSGYTLNLDKYSIDIAKPSAFGTFSVEGREGILAQVENTLSKDTKNNCILTGEYGSGKSTIVLGLAEKIYWGKSLPSLAYKRVVQLDVSALLAGAENERVIEERLIAVLNDAVTAGNIILFIDDIHTLFSDSSTGSIDASSVILPYLEHSSIRIIGVTTEGYYATYLGPKSSVAGNFEKIEVDEMDETQTIRIMEDLSHYYSMKYGIVITYAALKEIYVLAGRFVQGKGFPGKAVDMLDSIASAARNSGASVLTKDVVDSLAEKSLNIPIKQAGEGERDRLLNLESIIHARVIGQDEAVIEVADSLRRARAKVTDSKRPIGSFLFLGPTGVGKTELAKALAEAYFGDENSMIRMDMTEYQEVSSIERFIGKKLAGVMELEGGDFVKKVRENPFSVVLLDEIEKAHPDVLNLFLQVLDEGYITDGMGEKVILSNSIIIATSNAGANTIREGVSSGKEIGLLKEAVLEELQDSGIYRPEFLNRFDSITLFKPLTKDDLLKIGEIMFASIKSEFKKKGFDINLGPGVMEKIVDFGYQPELGARPMRRAFQTKVESLLAKKVLEGTLKKEEIFNINTTDLAL